MFVGSTHLNIQLYVPFEYFSLIDIWTNIQTYLALETPCRSLTINKIFFDWPGSKSMTIDKTWVQFHTNLIFQPPIIILELAQIQNQCPSYNTHSIKLYFGGSFQKTWLSLIIRRIRTYVKTDLESNIVWVNIRFKFLS